ncbi:MAG: TolC family protein, partial [Fimbriimonas ginsengisoli]|nr:TolC family protein [Fimbriimonas ginsengisoli]
MPIASGAAPESERRPPSIAGPIDLPAALQLAEKGNRRIAEAASQVESARLQVADTRGRLLPATTGSGRYNWYNDAQTTHAQLPAAFAGQLPPGASSAFDFKVRDAEVGTVNGTLALPIDLSGELRHALKAAQAGYRGERARWWATTLEQETLVVQTYFDLLQVQRLREVTQQTLALDQQQLATAQSRFQNGRVTKNDLLVVQVAVRNAEQRLRQEDLAIEQARWAFNQAIGAEVNAPTEVVDVRERPAVPATAEALRLAYAHNPVLTSLLEEQQRLDETVSSLVRSRLPRFNAGGAVDYSSSSLLQPQYLGAGFTGFTWDLGTDTRREAQIAEARVAADRNRIVMEQQLRALEAAIRSTQRRVEERLSALATAEAAVTQAEENLRIRQQQFEVGRAQSDD